MSRVAQILNSYQKNIGHDLEPGHWGNMQRRKQA